MDKDNPNNRDMAAKPQAVPEAPLAGASAEAYARRLEHLQRSRGRHAAITRNLYTWSNYKSWAEKVKGSFEPGGNK
jgi:hypothetical protein